MRALKPAFQKFSGLIFGVALLMGGLILTPTPAFAQTPEALKKAFTEDVSIALPPTTIVFDVYLAGEYRGEALVTYTDKWAKIHDPGGVAELLEDVKDYGAVKDLLSGEKIEGFKKELAEIGDVKVNPSNFQIELTLEPAVLKEKKNAPEAISLEPSDKPKLVNNFSAVTTNQLEGGGFEGTFSHRNAFSLGRNRLEFSGNYSEGQEDYELRNLLAAREEEDRLWQAGLLQTRGLEFARSQPVLGFSVGSNIDTLFNDTAITGDVVSVFVPSRSRVEVFANNRLVHTGILDFGLQQLNTNNFPQGSYELRIKLTEQATGKVSTQTQFYTKTTRLTPFNKPEWLFQFGFARDELNPNTAEPIWQGLYRNRVNSNLELGGSFLGSTNLNIIEPQARLFWNGLELRVNPSFSDSGDVAISAFGQLLTEKYGALTVQMRRTLAGHNTPIEAVKEDEFNPLSQELDIFSARWTRTFGRVQLTLQGTQAEISGRSSFRWGPSIRYPIIHTAKHHLELQGDYVFDNREKDALGALLTYQYIPFASHWRVNTQTSHRNGALGAQSNNTTQIEYDNRTNSQSTGTEFIATNSITNNEGRHILTQDIELEHTTDNFNAVFTGIHRREGKDTSGSIGLQASTTFAIDGNKNRFVGSSLGEATAIVELKGTAQGEVVLIKDGAHILARGRVGERVTVSLQAFRNYNITIEPQEEDALVRFDPKPHTFKLINRSVEILSFDVDRVYLLFGRLLGPNGNPLAWQRIKGASVSALTDQFGNFQTEVTPQDVMHVQNEEVRCTAAMPHVELENKVFKYVGDILCL